MSQEIKWAFAHPSERSAATSPEGPLDRISVRDHIVSVEIGAFQTERGTTQRICFNIVVEVHPVSGQVDDDVDRILSYDKVTEAIAYELAEERLNLLETLAERVAERILLEPQAERVFVRIEKLDRGPGALGVEIVRSTVKEEGAAEAAYAEERPHPHVVYLSNDAIASDNLEHWIDALVARPHPVILCVGPSDIAPPDADASLAQRRIDLLAIEQNAWVLGARDNRCFVVETRTELDWAMKNGQLCVWAPSKIVMDSVDRPPVKHGNGLELAVWLAREMGARDVLSIGETLPDLGDLSGQTVDIAAKAL